MVVSFALMHRSAENEFRAMKIFLNVKHEFRQKFAGINSAINYVTKSLVRQEDNEYVMKERLMKLAHVKNTNTEIMRLLDRFSFPLPSLENDIDIIKPFKPWADLVRPICETFSEKASQKKIFIIPPDKKQLGLMYSNISEWRQVIENIVNNMVKYTFEEKKSMSFSRKVKTAEG